jgi:hypothetical protein
VAAWPKPNGCVRRLVPTTGSSNDACAHLRALGDPSYQLRLRSYFRHTHRSIIAPDACDERGVIATTEGTNRWRKWLTWMRASGENERRKHAEWRSGSPQHGPGTICLRLRTDMSAWPRRPGNASSPLANGYDAAGV